MQYLAKVEKEDGSYLVSFPDLPNVNTFGDTLEVALHNAEEALNGALQADFGRGFELPKTRRHAGRGFHPVHILPHIAVAYELRRMRRGLSQTEIARRVGVSYQAVQKLENPKTSNPSIKTLEKIAGAFGKRVDIAFA